MIELKEPRKVIIKKLDGYKVFLENDSTYYTLEDLEEAKKKVEELEAEERARVEKENDEELNTIAENKRLRYQMERYIKDRSFTTKEDRNFLRYIMRESGINPKEIK